ncbi:MAG: helix-turn-helix transcriptional regulator [Clostridia bacterium]|nr:helix-turn-helix transcriptional regulator [Clostridia bacterium]
MSRNKTGSTEGAISSEAFGKRLKEIRLKKSIPIEHIVSKVGCTRPYLFQLERGQKNPSMDTLIRLIQVLDVSADEILCDYIPKRGTQIIAGNLVEQIASLPKESRERLEAHINLELELADRSNSTQ